MPKVISKQAPNKKHAGGRPSKFPSIKLSQVKFLYQDGKTDKQVARFLCINEDTLHEWKKKHPKFSESLKDWKAEADAKVEKSLYSRAIGYRTKVKKSIVVSDGKDTGAHVEVVDDEMAWPPDATSAIFWLKNRKPKEWRDVVRNLNLNVDADDKDFRDEFFGVGRGTGAAKA